MTTIRPWIGLAVFLSVTLIPAVAVRAQPQEWASDAALGDVLQGTHTAAGLPLIKVFPHGGGSVKDQITLGTVAASITGFAFDAENNLFVATDAGTIFKVNRTPIDPPGPLPLAHQSSALTNVFSTDIRQLKFDGNGKLYVGFGGSSPRIERYAVGSTSATLEVTHNVQCDVSPAPGLWFDLSARTLSTPAKQFAVYACGTKQVRVLDVLSTPPASGNSPTTLFATLPDLPGSAEFARHIQLLAPTGPLLNNAGLDAIDGVQGGLVIAYGTNIQWLDRFGVPIGSFDFDDGPASQNTWCCVAVSPTGGSVWGAETNTSELTRFRLSTGFTPQPELRFDTSSTLVTALAINGQPDLAQRMQLTKINGTPATFLTGTKWFHSFGVQADSSLSNVQLAVTSFEARTGGAADINIGGRFANFPGTTAVTTSRGRNNFFRVIKQSTQDISAAPTTIAIEYTHDPFDPLGSKITGLYDDANHSHRGFLTDLNQVNQTDFNIKVEWFKTDSLVRGKTIGTNDFIVATQTGSTVTVSARRSAELGGVLPIKANYTFPVDAAFCAKLVLTVVRQAPPGPGVIVGSSITSLADQGLGNPFFSPSGNSCSAQLQVDPNQSELGLDDFAAGRTYNFCVVVQNPPAQNPPSDACGVFSVM
jgi:hypothetical protein